MSLLNNGCADIGDSVSPTSMRPFHYGESNARFATQSGELQDIRLPILEFQPNFRGRTVQAPTLDPAQIRVFGLLIADRQAGRSGLWWNPSKRSSDHAKAPASPKRRWKVLGMIGALTVPAHLQGSHRNGNMRHRTDQVLWSIPHSKSRVIGTSTIHSRINCASAGLPCAGYSNQTRILEIH